MDLDHDLARAAMAYAERGWLVLPLWWPAPAGRCACGLPDCDSAGKHPIAHLVRHGLYGASARLDNVATWWRWSRRANVGIRTGPESGLVVLDVDGASGARGLRALVADYAPFETAWVRTGGGWHAYFAHPGGALPSSARQVGEGLDVRADGSYVVAPPSRHANGRTYRWIVLPPPTGELPPMPAWLLRLAVPAQRPSAEPCTPRFITGDAAAYAAAALASETQDVADAPPGQRNSRLNLAAFRLGQLVGAGLLDEPFATIALVDAGLAAGPGERKIRSTVRRGLQAGKRHPRRPSP
jgi:Bifunctional DNA primase/polymerase, N-terminal